MKRISIAITLLLSSIYGANSQEKPFMEDLSYYIENPAVSGLGQEEGRAWYIPESSISLNGRWILYR